MALLELTGISKAFSGVKVLQDVDFHLEAGRVHALAGENGAGKSTLMKILAGIHRADAGTMRLDGEPVSFANPREAMDAGIATIHQELNLVPTLSAGENIFLGREPRTPLGTIAWRRLFAEADELLDALEQPIDPRAPVSQLAVGQQQMVEIARALSIDARIIIMDEPTDALTDVETRILQGVIRRLRHNGKAVVFISHRLAEIFDLCDSIAVLRDGRLVHEGPTTSLDEDALIQHMVGRELADRYPYESAEPGPVKVRVDGLCAPGVQDVTFEARAGEVVGFGGLMGAGRTEMAKAICGEARIHAGRIEVDGRACRPRSPRDGLRAGIVYVPEDRKQEGLLLAQSVAMNLSLTALPRFSRLGVIDHGAENQAVADAVTRFHVKVADTANPLETLSGGNQQKVSLAKALMPEPEIVILDEPTRGVDVGAKREIYLLINALKRQGKCVLLISSDMPELLGIADRVIVLAGGRVSAEYPRDEATQERIMGAAADFPTNPQPGPET
ncbi:sugar ABC transporter ATP-binding protein [Arhodomonas sp. AD133]|uniref:sugar ABC transporter ATP-binding protein n=1 Tax=Arhodomonas sp. AD133 TaxID=3415009 RepID=UPI003EBCB400